MVSEENLILLAKKEERMDVEEEVGEETALFFFSWSDQSLGFNSENV